MAEELIDLQVFCEDTNELILIKVHPSDVERARSDSQYLVRLVNEEYERRSLMAINQESQILACSDNDHTQTTSQTEEGTVSSENETSIFIWTSECVHLLLSLYEEHEAEFRTGTKRHKKVWETIAMLIEKHGYIVTWGQCQSKMNGLKKTYKKILDHNNVSGNDRMTWPYFKRMDEIFGKSSWVKPRALATEAGPNENVSTAGSSSPSNNTGEPKTSKRRRWDIEKQTERVKSTEEWHRIKIKKIDEMIEQKERLHKEKLELMHALLRAVSNSENK